MAKDALEVVMVDGQPTFPNLPRKGDGTPDWDRLGGELTKVRSRTTGRVHDIDGRPSVPHPQTGAPTRPE
jgi:hypothetical protein